MGTVSRCPHQRCTREYYLLYLLRSKYRESAAMKVLLVATCLVAACSAATLEYGQRQGKLKPAHLLRSYQGLVNDFHRTGDTYTMEYHVGDSHRFEQRSESGEVTGTYAFVAPEGDEFEFRYEANNDGFHIEGDALPQAPEDTDDVKAARDAFFEAYEKQAELTADYDYSEESSEEDSESSEEDDDESSEEGDESSEESSEEDSEEEEEEEEEEEQEKPSQGYFSGRSRNTVTSSARSRDDHRQDLLNNLLRKLQSLL